jgi:hypothetical protein
MSLRTLHFIQFIVGMKKSIALFQFLGVIQASIAKEHDHGHHPIKETDSLPQTLFISDNGRFLFPRQILGLQQILQVAVPSPYCIYL